MAYLRYPGVAGIPQSRPVLDGVIPALEFGRARRLEDDAIKAFDELYRSQGPQGGGMSISAIAPPQQQELPDQAVSAAPQSAPAVIEQTFQSLEQDPVTSEGLNAYIANARQAESGGDPNARNPRSTATGLYQFTEGTWSDLVQNQPELGLTPDGRTDPEQQERAMRAFTAGNARSLSGAGLAVTPGSLYAAHFLGAGGARGVLSQPDETPMTSAVSAEVINANPFLASMSVGDFRQWANEKGGGANGGYAPPAVPQQGMASQPPQQKGGPSREVMRALFANPSTRAFAVQLAQQASQGVPVQQFQTLRQPDGSVWQIDMASGKVDILQDSAEAGSANRRIRNDATGRPRYEDTGELVFPDVEVPDENQPTPEEQQIQENKYRSAQQTAAAMINSIDAAIEKSGFFTTGIIGTAGRTLGSAPNIELEGAVDTVKANLGFQALQQMRDASPTGGALGQVTERELAMLQATVNSLDLRQGEAQLDKNLRNVRNLVMRNAIYRQIDREGIPVDSQEAQRLLSQYPIGGESELPNIDGAAEQLNGGTLSSGLTWSLEQ